MASPLARLHSDPPSTDAETAVLAVDDERADTVLDALGSDTARTLFRALHDEPVPASVLARRTGTSVQNAHYHLSNLETAGLVEVVDVRYSEKGNEMDVYAPAADPIVLVGDETPAAKGELRRLLTDWAAGVVTIGLVSLAIQLAVERLFGGSGPELFEPASRGMANWTVSPLAEAIAAPGLLFFLGGVAVLTLGLVFDSRN